MKKAAVFLAFLLAFALLAEGLLSLFLGTSLTRIGRQRSLLERLTEQDLAAQPEALRSAARTVGPYRVPADPLVGYTLKLASEVDYFDQHFRTDAFGLRPRPGGAPPVGAFHVVVLGDSVAYGHGLPAEQNLAAQLERVFAEASVPGERPIACSTVGLPGWNYRNSTRHLLDHLDRIAPHLVLFLPVKNDLEDGDGVNEAGQRRQGPDAGVPHPLCRVTPPLDLFRTLGGVRLGARELAERNDDAAVERWAVFSGLTHSSRWRLEDMADSLAHLARRLERVEARLALAPFVQHDLHRQVRARLLERGLDLPVLPMLGEFLHADGLGRNPHPNAETTRAMALWCARALLDDGLVPRPPERALAAVPETLAGRQTRELTPAELVRWRELFERGRAAALEARIEPARLAGLGQIYGGVNADGTLGIEAALVLPPGRRLALELASASDSPGLYPLTLSVEVDGEPVGTLTLRHATDSAAAQFALGAEHEARPFEVRIRAADWGLERVGERRRPVAARLVAVTSLR